MSTECPKRPSPSILSRNQSRLTPHALRPASLLLALLPLCVGQAAAYAGEPAKLVSPVPAVSDPRHISNGWNIPSEGYADQPYIVQADGGAWLCVMTTGVGVEGAGGQHVVSMRSTDQGRTWEQIVPIEPTNGPEASYAVLLKVPGGRIYAFYSRPLRTSEAVGNFPAGLGQR